MSLSGHRSGFLGVNVLRPDTRVVIVGLVVLVCGGCQPPRPAPQRDATGPARPGEIAIVRPQYDAHISVSIVAFDGTNVDRYLGGWGVRPKEPEIGVEPGRHTFEVGCYEFKTRTASPGTVTLELLAQPGHLYEIHAGPRGFFSTLWLSVARARTPTWTAWVEDKGPVKNDESLTVQRTGVRRRTLKPPGVRTVPPAPRPSQ